MGRSIAIVVACALGAAGLAAPLAASAKAAAVAAYRAPRGPDKVHPDLNGVWQALTPANWNIEAHAAQSAWALRPGPLGPVPAKSVVALGAAGSVPPTPGIVVGGTIPYKPEALKTRDDNRAHAIERDPEVKCYLPGVPRATYMPYPFEIFQSDKSMLIDYEYDGAVRNILFKDPGPAPVDAWMGQSVAHWEGDTLVVKVTGLLDQSWLDRSGNFHSDQMTVVERYTPTSPYTMKYEAEITDPETYTRPWKIALTLYKSAGPDVQLGQFKCVEFVEELMYGDLRREPLK
ncbi:MAG: hypothetical protein DI524_08415 [Ectopseudomonas oleovorans]|nr:MAG: hypothetical protein DI524_08415 [Pseudomonas oleovorans]